MLKCVNSIKDYIPRHLRLGLSADVPVLEAYQDIVESVPVIDDDGSVVTSHTLVKRINAHEVMSKYNVSQFRLSALVKAGVPLKMVNINSSTVASIEQLKNVVERLDNADLYVQRVLDERKERESWFKPIEETNK